MKKQIRFISIILCILTGFSLLCSCAPRPLAQGSLAGKAVGTIKGGSEEYTVYYEDFYPLAYQYYKESKAKHGDNSEALEKEVWDLLKENIIIKYAKLDLCKSAGLEYNESELRDRVNAEFEKMVAEIYDGDYDKFLEAQDKLGSTDHYMRFDAGIELLYVDLGIEYQKQGIVPNTDEKIAKYIKENFIHTWHITRYVDKGDDRDAEYARAQEALEKLKDGTAMYYVFKDNHEDLLGTLSNTDGNYFQKNVCPWGEDYEKAVLSLKAGKYHNEVITSQAISPFSGELVECFYVIQRLPILDSEIQANFEQLSDTVKNSILSKKLDEKISNLSFEPNDYAKELNLAKLEIPTNGIDYQLVIAICISAGALVLLIVGVFTFRALRAKRFQKNLKKKK